MTSMQDRLPNGASVNRLWSDNKTELLALFQYQNDAEMFAKAKLQEDAERKWTDSRYIVSDTYRGTVQIFAPTSVSSGE